MNIDDFLIEFKNCIGKSKWRVVDEYNYQPIMTIEDNLVPIQYLAVKKGLAKDDPLGLDLKSYQQLYYASFRYYEAELTHTEGKIRNKLLEIVNLPQEDVGEYISDEIYDFL